MCAKVNSSSTPTLHTGPENCCIKCKRLHFQNVKKLYSQTYVNYILNNNMIMGGKVTKENGKAHCFMLLL